MTELLSLQYNREHTHVALNGEILCDVSIEETEQVDRGERCPDCSEIGQRIGVVHR